MKLSLPGQEALGGEPTPTRMRLHTVGVAENTVAHLGFLQDLDREYVPVSVPGTEFDSPEGPRACIK